jgi:hypothetical protein
VAMIAGGAVWLLIRGWEAESPAPPPRAARQRA